MAIRRDPEDLADAINVPEMTHWPLRNKPSARCHRILSSAPSAIGERCLCFIHKALGVEGHSLARTLGKSSGCHQIAPSPSSAISTDQGLQPADPVLPADFPPLCPPANATVVLLRSGLQAGDARFHVGPTRLLTGGHLRAPRGLPTYLEMRF